MATDWNDRKVLCPFYIGQSRDRHWIICEGHGYARRNISEYQTEDDRRIQLRVFCRCHYANCEHYRAVHEEKYSEEK